MYLVDSVERDGRQDELEHLGQAQAQLPAHAEAGDATPLQRCLQQTRHAPHSQPSVHVTNPFKLMAADFMCW